MGFSLDSSTFEACWIDYLPLEMLSVGLIGGFSYLLLLLFVFLRSPTDYSESLNLSLSAKDDVCCSTGSTTTLYIGTLTSAGFSALVCVMFKVVEELREPG